MTTYATPYYGTPGYASAGYQASPYQAGLYQANPYRPTPYQASPYQTSPYQTSPYQTSPYQSTPYQATPYQATPYQATPYQTTTYQTTATPAAPVAVYPPAGLRADTCSVNSTSSGAVVGGSAAANDLLATLSLTLSGDTNCTVTAPVYLVNTASNNTVVATLLFSGPRTLALYSGAVTTASAGTPLSTGSLASDISTGTYWVALRDGDLAAGRASGTSVAQADLSAPALTASSSTLATVNAVQAGPTSNPATRAAVTVGTVVKRSAFTGGGSANWYHSTAFKVALGVVISALLLALIWAAVSHANKKPKPAAVAVTSTTLPAVAAPAVVAAAPAPVMVPAKA